MADKAEDDPRRAKHLKDVERRAKFLATLTPSQRRQRDNHIAWVRWWRKEYVRVVHLITLEKNFIKRQGHNNLFALSLAMKRLRRNQMVARGMLLARVASKVDYAMKVNSNTKPAPARAKVAA